MFAQFPTWKPERQVQLAYTLKRDVGDYYLEIAINPLGGYRLPDGVQQAAASVIKQMEG
jgi:hypothetical protein